MNEKNSSRSRRSTVSNGTKSRTPTNGTNSNDVKLPQLVRSRPHIKLMMTYEQIMKKTYILNLQPSTRDSDSEYILADSEDAKFFSLQKNNNVWTLYLTAPERRKETIIFHVGILDKVNRDSFELHLELAIVPESAH